MGERIRLRLKFIKEGAMRFVGHLDLMRTFQKLIRRAHLDVAYSEGFHPHQLLSFANPLGVGLESEGEYADLVMNSRQDEDEVIRALNEVTVDGIAFTGASYLEEKTPKAMAQVSEADYLVMSADPAQPGFPDLYGRIEEFLAQPSVLIEKKSKKGNSSMDIREGIVEVIRQGDALFMKLRAGSALNIRPEYVLTALASFASVSLPAFRIRRLEQYDGAGRSLLEAL